MANDHPLFIYRYMDRTEVQKDSKRFRVRVAMAFDDFGSHRHDIGEELKRQAGIRVPLGNHWHTFWIEGDLRDVLTAITIGVRYMSRFGTRSPLKFIAAVSSAMQDENLGLRIDETGVVHFAVDDDFEASRLATLSGLDDPRLQAARVAYETAFSHMDVQPPRTKEAVRAAFEAVEILARQLAPTHKNLHINLCKVELKAVCLPVLGGDGVEQKVLAGFFDSLGEWVSAIHHYRHGQPQSSPPSAETAAFVLSSASSYVRVLARVAIQVLPA
jgi:hypothetical protein